MLCFVAIPGIWTSGCFRSQALPATNSIGRLPGWADQNGIFHDSIPAIPSLPTRPPQGKGNSEEPSVTKRHWSHIVIHHTASTNGSVDSIHKSHLQRKDSVGNPWLGIGYHFVIGNGNGMGDGEVQPTFRWDEQIHGAHAGIREYNQHGIGIVLVGNFDYGPPSVAQMAAVQRLVENLATDYSISNDRIVGHGDVKDTNCPGRYFPLDDIKRSLTHTSLSRNESNPSFVFPVAY